MSLEALLASILMEIKFIISDMTIMLTQYTFFFLLRVRMIRMINFQLILFTFCFHFCMRSTEMERDVWVYLHLSSRIKADFSILHPAPNCTESDGYNCAHLLLGARECIYPHPSFGAEWLPNPYMHSLNLNSSARVLECHESKKTNQKTPCSVWLNMLSFCSR